MEPKARKVYRGIRMDDHYAITVNGQPLHHVVHHSPTGFCWGYHGSGPADAALSILADHFNERPTPRELSRGLCRCWAIYQDLKREFIAAQPMDNDWELTSEQLEAFVARHRGKLADVEERIQLWRSIEQADLEAAIAEHRNPR